VEEGAVTGEMLAGAAINNPKFPLINFANTRVESEA